MQIDRIGSDGSYLAIEAGPRITAHSLHRLSGLSYYTESEGFISEEPRSRSRKGGWILVLMLLGFLAIPRIVFAQDLSWKSYVEKALVCPWLAWHMTPDATDQAGISLGGPDLGIAMSAIWDTTIR